MAKTARYSRGLPVEKISPLVEVHFDSGTLILRGAPDDIRNVLKTEEFGGVDDERIGALRLPAMHYRKVVGELIHNGVHVADFARSYEDDPLWDVSDRVPRPHQEEALTAWDASNRRGVVVLPTGAGKSHLAVMAIALTSRGALIVAPTLDLVEQWVRLLKDHFQVPVGSLGGGTHDPQVLTVSTYDSAAIHMERLGNRWGLLILDEVHHLPSDMYRWVAEASIAPFRLGLTATLERSDGRHHDIATLVGPTVYSRSTRDLAGGVLSEYDVELVEVPFSAQDLEIYTQARETYRGFVEARRIKLGGARGWQNFLRETSRSREGRMAFKAYLVQKRLALGHMAKRDEVARLLNKHASEQTLIFANDNATVYALSQRLLCPALTHHTSLTERAEILERFRNGTYRAVVTSRVLNEGVDVPAASVAIILSGTGSVREHVQRLGRILRHQEGKRAILYELITPDSAETFVSQRRREHDAYR